MLTYPYKLFLIFTIRSMHAINIIPLLKLSTLPFKALYSVALRQGAVLSFNIMTHMENFETNIDTVIIVSKK